MEEDGFEPSKALPTDLQSALLTTQGTPPQILNLVPEAESNHRHEDFQSTALPTELSGQTK